MPMARLQCELNFPGGLRQTVRCLSLAAMAGLALAVPGCATDKQKAALPSLVWPAPPEEPRVSFVQSIAQPSDLGFKNSGWSRIANWLVGAQKSNEKLSKPFGIALDDADNLCLTDTGANVVCYFDAAQKRW
jgi:hypothetical protein